MTAATLFFPSASPNCQNAGWQLSAESTHPAATLLERQLPVSSNSGPQVIVLPLVTEPERDWSPWHLFPDRLAVLLAVVPRDAVFACNATARDAVASRGQSPKSAWQWLLAAVGAGVAVNKLSPHVLDDLQEWRRQLPDLAPRRPGSRNDWLLAALNAAPAESFVPQSRDPISTIALQAGIFQWHDYLDESHSCSQQIEGEGPGQLGDYWHGIMHRREPDASNAKYWFRRVGKQSIFPQVAHAADRILGGCDSPDAPLWRDKVTAGGRWDPFAFIDLCSACENRTDDLALAARHIQFIEMAMLLKETWRAATHA